MGIKTRRVGFTFDDQSIRTLEEMTAEGKYSSMADCVRESLQITRALSFLAGQGFTQLIVRRPDGGSFEKEIIVPRFKARHE